MRIELPIAMFVAGGLLSDSLDSWGRLSWLAGLPEVRLTSPWNSGAPPPDANPEEAHMVPKPNNDGNSNTGGGLVLSFNLILAEKMLRFRFKECLALVREVLLQQCQFAA